MGWRIVFLQNPARLSLKDKQLVITQNEEDTAFPVEDLCAVILESLQITITSSVLSYFQEKNVILIICDEKHTPNGLLHNLYQHSRQTQIAYLQKQISPDLHQCLWDFIIKKKISNQAKCLSLFELDGGNDIIDLKSRIVSGDRLNIESQAARIYWRSFFGDTFKRHNMCSINATLNYAYSILRSLMCRSIVSYGLIPCFGIHHKSELNAFNLADDLIEPFRPIIDKEVKKIIQQHIGVIQLTKEIRQKLVMISFVNCIISNEIYTLHNCVEKTVKSYVNVIRQKIPDIIELPDL